MKISKGWLRIWLLLTALITCISTSLAFGTRDINEMTGSTWYCVPGTTESYPKEVADGYITPSNTEIAEEAKKPLLLNPDATQKDREFAAMINLQKEKTKWVDYFSCLSDESLIGRILLGFLLSLAPALCFLAYRWVLRGFTRAS